MWGISVIYNSMQMSMRWKMKVMYVVWSQVNMYEYLPLDGLEVLKLFTLSNNLYYASGSQPLRHCFKSMLIKMEMLPFRCVTFGSHVNGLTFSIQYLFINE